LGQIFELLAVPSNEQFFMSKALPTHAVTGPD